MSAPAAVTLGRYTTMQLTSIFVSTLLGYSLDGYNLLILSFLMPYIASDMHLSPVATGTIFSMQLVASMLGGVLFGWIADALGRKNGLILSIALYSVGALVSGFSWNLASLMVLRFITGLGLGGEWGIGMALFNEAWSPTRRGLGAAVIQSSFLAGVSVAGIVAAAIIGAAGPTGWRVALMTGFIPVVLVLVIRLWMPESHLWREYHELKRAGRLPEEKRRQSAPVVEIFRGKALILTIMGLLLVGGFMFAFYGVSTFVPTLIVKGYHARPATFAAVNTAVTWISIPIYIVFGGLSDAWGRKKAFLVPGLAMAAGSIALFVVTRTPGTYPGSIWVWGLFWAYLLWYAGTSAAALFGVWLSEVFPVEIRATAVSVTYMIGRGASALSPIVVPAFAAGVLLGRAMGIVSLIGTIVMLAFGLLLPETRGRIFHVIDHVVAGHVAEPRVASAERVEQ